MKAEIKRWAIPQAFYDEVAKRKLGEKMLEVSLLKRRIAEATDMLQEMFQTSIGEELKGLDSKLCAVMDILEGK